MKRLVYLAVLSMAIMVVSAPTALAQQGNGLCTGAQTVDSFSNNTDILETRPFDINTDTFQVALETTPVNDSGFTFFTVFDSNGTAINEGEVDAGGSTVVTVENNGSGPFDLSIGTSLQAYDIIVYECGAAPVAPEEPMAEEPMAEEPMAEEPMAEEPAVEQYDDNGVADSQYGDDEVVEEEVADDEMKALPDTGGPSLLLLGTTLLVGGGILGLATLRRRSE